MQVEAGKILEGKVSGITNFGAFIDLGEGVTGMVHISEIANTYVNEIKDYLTENQTVKVKVLAVTPEGKISLSIKRVGEDRDSSKRPSGRPPRRDFNSPRRNSGGFNANKNEPASFEDMMNKFKQSSEEKMSDLKRSVDNKRGRGRGGSR